MSETPSGRQTGGNQDGREPIGSSAATPPAAGSLEAGGAFLKAVAGDLNTVRARLARRLRLSHRRTPLQRASAPRRIALGSVAGRAVRRLTIVFLWLASVGVGAVCGATLWVLYGLPIEPGKSDATAPGLRVEAARAEPQGRAAPLNAGDASRPDNGRGPVTPASPEGCRYQPFDPRRLCETGSSTPDSVPPDKAAGETPAEAGLGPAVQPPPTPVIRPPDIAGTATGPQAPMRCDVKLCAARYSSFHAADCTYQPYGGGPRSLCALDAQSADALPQTLRAATDRRPAAAERQAADKPEVSARAGPQCNADRCAATHKSFNAADCTYQPYGGGPRRRCDSRAAAAPSGAPHRSTAAMGTPVVEEEDDESADAMPPARAE